MRYLKPALMAAGLLATFAPALGAHAADCHFTPYSFQFGTDASTEMTVKSGKVCSSNLRIGSGGGTSRASISQPASNGAATTDGNGRWQYVSRRGFTGSDQFVVDITGETMTNRHVFNGTSHISVAVTVVP